MQIKKELRGQINDLCRVMRDAQDDWYTRIPAPCRYFGACSTSVKKPLKASCANCRAERMVTFDNALADVDCYTLMIIDFLKSCGVEVEDES